jgi:hypothetical protein
MRCLIIPSGRLYHYPFVQIPVLNRYNYKYGWETTDLKWRLTGIFKNPCRFA